MRVTILGLGYIGLPSAALIASRGITVNGYDINSDVVTTINRGETHIIENDLEQLVRQVVKSGHLRVHNVPQAADVYVIAVPTPFHDDKVPDISCVKAATESIAPLLQPGNLIILESTCPVGTTELLTQWLLDTRSDLTFEENGDNTIYCAYCPERVLPGKTLYELVHNSRVIGGINSASAQKAKAFYEIFVESSITLTNSRTAELAKLTENTFRDVNIAFANELAGIAEDYGVNVGELISVANQHPRVNILNPGIGVGGHCIAVDPWFIIKTTSASCPLISCARTINMERPVRVSNRILDTVHKLNANKIACLGLTYKQNINDVRESPAVEVVSTLALKCKGKLFVVEPHISALPKSLSVFNNIIFSDLATAISEADMIVVLVAHNQFKQIIESITNKPVFDFVGILSAAQSQLNKEYRIQNSESRIQNAECF